MWVHLHLERVEKAIKVLSDVIKLSPLKSGLHLNYWHADDKSYIPLRISRILRCIARVEDAAERAVVL